MSHQRGDTLIEVLLATVVISIVIAAAFTLTNRASRGNQAAIERTTVANLMREQVELVRGIRTSGYKTGSWNAIINNHTQSASPDYSSWDVSSWDVPTNTSKSFFIDPNTADLQDVNIVKGYNATDCPIPNADAYPDDLFCIWVEAHLVGSNDYVDIHVRAYWDGIGDLGPQRESLILRLQK